MKPEKTITDGSIISESEWCSIAVEIRTTHAMLTTPLRLARYHAKTPEAKSAIKRAIEMYGTDENMDLVSIEPANGRDTQDPLIYGTHWFFVKK